ncbi:bcl2-associated agonist of cell death [Pimephales promelas]|nr:bcl2-associated agonist of cell death [Pimephales promelas]
MEDFLHGCVSVGRSKESKQSQSKTPETQQARSPGSLHLRHQKSCSIMAQMFTISDESETTEDLEDSGQTEHNSGSSERKQHLTASDRLKGEQLGRHRNLSMNEEDLMETGAADEGDFRPRSRSAPPALWAAKKYGQQLRRMSDEFDILLDKGVRKQLFRY